MAIGETISANEFNKRYPSKVGQTLSAQEFNARYQKQFTRIDKTAQLEKELANAKAESAKAQGFLKNPIRQFGSALGDVFVGGATRLAMTAAEAVPTIKSGGATPQWKVNSPFEYQGKVEGYLSKQQRTAEEVAQNKKPLLASIEPMAQAVGDVVDVAQGLKAGVSVAKNAINLGKSVAQKLASKPKVNLAGAVKMVSEPLNKKASIELLKSGKTQKSGFWGNIEPVASVREVEIARTAQPFLDKDPLKSINNIRKEISRVSSNEIVPYLEANQLPYTSQTMTNLMTKIDKIEPESLITKSDVNLSAAVKAIKENAKQLIRKNAKDDLTLYKTRQLLDDMIDTETKGKAFETASAASDTYMQIRRMLNDFIAEGIPEGKKMFLDKLKYENKLFDAAEGIAKNNYKMLGSNFFGRHKTFTKALETTGNIAAAGAGAGLGIAGINKIIGD